LLQALGVPVSSAQRILTKSKDKSPTFIGQGPVKQLVSEQPSLPVQWPKMIHRFPLTQNTYAVSAHLNTLDSCHTVSSVELHCQLQALPCLSEPRCKALAQPLLQFAIHPQ
jgi:hypothetical protein